MKELLLSKEVIKRVIEEDKTFKEAIKEVFLANEKDVELTPIVSALSGCELRHHLFLSKLVKEFDLGDNKYLLLLALANNFFLRRIDKEKVTSFIKETLNESYNEKINKLLTFDGAALDSLGESVDHSSMEFVSLRFNVPSYLLKMWFKHYGRSLTYKVLKKNIKPSNQYFRINTMKISEEDFLKEHPSFVSSNVKDVVYLSTKENIHKLKAYQNYEIFNIRLALKEILDKVYTDDIEEMTLYLGDDKAATRDLYVRTNKKAGLRVAVNNLDEHPDLLRLIRLEKCKNVTYFVPNDYSLMDLAITSPQDLVVVYPKSSSFDKIRKYPDYLLHFKQDSLDSLIDNQKASLEGFSKFVRPGCKLVYIVDTLDKKESVAIINDFVNRHKEFELIESKQYFSFEDKDTLMYYAILKKKDND